MVIRPPIFVQMLFDLVFPVLPLAVFSVYLLVSLHGKFVLLYVGADGQEFPVIFR